MHQSGVDNFPSNLFLALICAMLIMNAGSGCSHRQHAEQQTSARLGSVTALPDSLVPNFVQVSSNLYRGGQPTAVGFRELADLGINVVVDVRGDRDKERQLVTRLGMQYVSMEWHCPFPRDELFARFLELVRRNPDKKIFIHCRLGDDRVGMMVAAYRMAFQGWPVAAAKAEMKADGFTALHHLICPSLSAYASSFPRRLQKNPAFASFRRATVVPGPETSSSHR